MSTHPRPAVLMAAVSCLTVFTVASTPLLAQPTQVKPGFNLFSEQQDVEIGRQSAAEAERQLPLLNDRRVEGYATEIIRRLAAAAPGAKYPYQIRVVNASDINAFSLPGGFMYVNRGLIEAARTEPELAAVLAHEMAHVALRHGTHQASKANFIELPAAIAGAVIGNNSMLGSLARLGINLGAESVLLKYSRTAESEADANGALIMNDTGYNPIEMARFFQKLESEGSKGNSLLASWLSDHPSPGNRVKAVEDEIRYLPKTSYSEMDPAALPRVKAIVAKLPPPPPKATTQGGVSTAPPCYVSCPDCPAVSAGSDFRLPPGCRRIQSAENRS